MKRLKEERPALASKPGVKLITAIRYAALPLLANTFAAPFWFFAQRRRRLMDQLENESLWP